MKHLHLELKVLLNYASCLIAETDELKDCSYMLLQHQHENPIIAAAENRAALSVEPNSIQYKDSTSDITWDLSALSCSLQVTANTGVLVGDCEKELRCRYSAIEKYDKASLVTLPAFSDLISTRFTNQMMMCSECRTTILNSSKFDRILPLPSKGWAEMAGDWFCHQHDSGSSNSTASTLCPRPGDLLTGYYSSLTHLDQVVNLITSTSTLTCSTCNALIGQLISSKDSKSKENVSPGYEGAGSSVVELNHHSLCFSSSQENTDITPLICLEHVFAANLLDHCKYAMTYQFVVEYKPPAGKLVPSILVWVLETDLQFLFGDSDGSTECVDAIRILYADTRNKSEQLVQEWLRDDKVSILILPETACSKLLDTLRHNTSRLPKSMNKASEMTISFLQTKRN